MRVLGIDPGYDRMGVAIIEKIAGSKEKLIFSDCLTTNKKESFADRLFYLGQSVEKLITETKPEVMALEKVYVNNNQKTASAISEVRGMLIYLAGIHKLKIFEYTPIEIKVTVTGYGGAKKDQVIEMVKLITPINKEKIVDDEFDAIATGLTCLAREKLSF